MLQLHQKPAKDFLLKTTQSWDYCLTSPPYYNLIDYGHKDQYGLEIRDYLYIDKMAEIFVLIYHNMSDNGILWLNIADSYNNYSCVGQGSRRGRDADQRKRRQPERDRPVGSLLNIPERLLDRLIQIGWMHRETIIWDQGPTSSGQPYHGNRCHPTHEYIYVLGKSKITRPKLNYQPLDRSVIQITPTPTDSHPCKMPQALADLLLGTASNKTATVIDPFCGTGTTLIAAHKRGYNAIGVDLNTSAAQLAIANIQLSLL